MSRIEEALRRAGYDVPMAPIAAEGVAVETPTDWAQDEAAPASDVSTGSAGPSNGHAHAHAASAVDDGAQYVIEREDPTLDGKLVLTRAIPQASVEQYRRLAATLHHEQVERGIKVVMVASALSGEGKTLTATNLALTLSHSYDRRVLLIDADLRRPAIHRIFNLPNTSGLNEGLRADVLQKLSLLQVSPRLAVLPAGKPDPDPMRALTSGRMRRVLAEAAEAFEWVIVDTPPVTVLPDANLLASMVDAAVLVVGAGKTPCASVQRAISGVGRDRILGVVLNRVAEGVLGRQFYYDTYSYTGEAATAAAMGASANGRKGTER
jgi:capsular exopolysaccharide synthesis family protein